MTTIHRDVHLDNVLFRPDGSPVLLDWTGASVGPAAVDLAALVTAATTDGPALRPEDVATADAAESARTPGAATVGEVKAAVVLRRYGTVRWAARGPEPGTRARDVCAAALGTTRAAVEWLSDP